MYGGIGQCNLVLDDLSQLNPSKFNLSDSEFDSFKAATTLYESLLFIFACLIVTVIVS